MNGSAPPAPRTFTDLLAACPDAQLCQPAGGLIGSVHFDSRQVGPGACFVARRGLRDDGHAYVASAIAAGAVAVVAERPVEAPAHVGLAIVPDGRWALAALARRLWGEPDLALGTVGVTGTDGKTSTSHLIAAMLEAQGRTAGAMTTVGTWLAGDWLPAAGRLTTPEPPVIARQLRDLVDAGADWAVLEVASHALELRRVDGFSFDRAVITNVTHEHLDLHGSIEGYRRAKRRLLDLLDATPATARGRAAILNADDPVVAGFAGHTRSDVITFGQQPDADVQSEWIELDDGRRQVRLHSPWGRWTVRTNLAGPWNAANIAAATACVGSICDRLDDAMAALPSIASVPGRMQSIDCGQPFRVFVDFAHTPAALEACLRALRPQTPGRLIALFGSAGDQDRSKRPLLGRAAVELADWILVADEDPRNEDPQAIAEAVVAGAREARPDAWIDIVLDRRMAIHAAIAEAGPGDTVLLAGKGHETSIAYADRTIAWNEATVARAALAAAGFPEP
ncbi:MAG: UDP-N-acetylmuramoyl-L-alanyl-D-glutamate--2,6-diaminopimelate ligase [Chloroflexi bacterium]|nr:UDP-N-acetylmuramoyl-L-alanyl-D-glutamate--2,6-diaminopimelate ligase [Chloroflexota bacterium]